MITARKKVLIKGARVIHMKDDFQEAIRTLTIALSKAGKGGNPEDVRKWMQPHAKILPQLLTKGKDKSPIDAVITEVLPEGDWQGTIALNQILYLIRAEEYGPDRAKELLHKVVEVWQKQPLNLSALLAKWRMIGENANLDPEVILDTITYDASEQSLFDPDTSQKPLDYFMNLYKMYYDIDVDTLYDSAQKILEKYTDEFFRLVDIDKPMDPEEFVKRVEKALDMIAAAKEQGIELKKVFSEWDRLADEGGERLEKLPAAIKAVAEEAVREKFWVEALARLNKLKVPVIEEKTDITGLLGKLHTMGIVQISGNEIKLGQEFDEMANVAVSILLKTSPSAMYTSKDVIDTIDALILSRISDKRILAYGLKALEKLNVLATKRLLEEKELVETFWKVVADTYRKGGIAPEELAEALNETLKDEHVGAENLEKEILNKIREIKEG